MFFGFQLPGSRLCEVLEELKVVLRAIVTPVVMLDVSDFLLLLLRLLAGDLSQIMLSFILLSGGFRPYIVHVKVESGIVDFSRHNTLLVCTILDLSYLAVLLRYIMLLYLRDCP